MFVEQFSPVTHSVYDRNLQAIVAGDLNIGMLKYRKEKNMSNSYI